MDRKESNKCCENPISQEWIDCLEVNDTIKEKIIIGAEPIDYPNTDGISLYIRGKDNILIFTVCEVDEAEDDYKRIHFILEELPEAVTEADVRKYVFKGRDW